MISNLVIQFVAQRRARQEISAASAESYRYRLFLFSSQHDHLDVKQINRRHIERWLEQTGRSAAYKRALLVACRQFFDWCIANGHTTRNPAADVATPRLPRRVPRALTATEVAQVLEVVPDRRAKAMVLLMVQEGLRRGAVAALEIGDVDPARRTIAIRSKGGRGGITQVLPLSGQTAAALADYLVEHPAPNGPLFRNYHTDAALTPASISRMVAQWMRLAGVKRAAYDGKSAHSFRHTAAIDVLEESGDIHAVQMMLGHQDLSTTGIYLRSRVGGLGEAMGGRNYGLSPLVPLLLVLQIIASAT